MADPTITDLAARLAVVEATMAALAAQSQQLAQDPRRRVVTPTVTPEQLATLIDAHAAEVSRLQARIADLEAQLGA